MWRDHAFATADAPTLLTPLQERVLWKRAQREDAELVISADSMAALAMEAWWLLSAYKAHGTRRSAWDHADAERFRHWASLFEQLGSRHGWLSASQLEQALLAPLSDPAHIPLPQEMVLAGFDRLTPAQGDVLDAVRARGVAVSVFQPEHEFARAAERRWIAATDLRQEIEACARWARDILAENPTARIGVVASTPAARGAIDRAFRHALLPASEDIRQPSVRLPWEFSLGQPLADVPAICAALLLLRWTTGSLSEEEVSWLMLSGFVADTATNSPAVAHHDARLRRFAVLSTERTLLSYRDSLASSPRLHDLRFRLSDLWRAAEQNRLPSVKRQPSAFADLVPRLLERVAWPGQRPDDSVQFQARQRWQRLLDELALLDFDGTPYSWKEFVDLLRQQAEDTIFAPESHDAPIQVLGPFESSGQQFDEAWFLGTDDTAWPQRGRLHPLLPATVQRQHGMPHAAPDDDWSLAGTVTTRLLHSAARIVFSFAERDKDAELRPSPLIAGLFPGGSAAQAVAGDAEEAGPALAFDTVADDAGVPGWPQEQNAGGAEVLKRQAACPFQAFATRRLRAEALDESEWGISPSEKGKLLHAVMQRLFSSSEPLPIRSRDDLVTAIATKQLPGILEAHIAAAMQAQFGATIDDPWQQACLAAEKRRLMLRVGDWLALEASRQPFTVESCEERLRDVHVGNLKLNLRADRIDRLPDGSRLLLDYKTGNVSIASWDGDRPDDPQLPLYAAYGNVENVSGILFARIRSGKIDFEGRVRDAQAQLSAGIKAKKTLVTASLLRRDAR